jgi:putative transposase
VRRLFSQFAGACRWVFNRGLAQKKEAWERDKRSVSLYEQNKELAQLKKEGETAWLKEVHSQVLQQSLGDLDQAFKHFFRRVKQGVEQGYPRFKSKGDHDSFRYPQGVRVSDDKVYLPKIGWVRFRKSRELKGEIKQTTIIKEGAYWYVSFSCQWEENILQSNESPSIVGIDLGLESFAIMADGERIEKIENPRFLRHELNHLKFLSRQLSRKEKWSKNWRKAKEKLQSFHAKIRSKRNDFLHKLSTAIVKSHDVVVVESLKVKSLLEKSPRFLARSISDAGWRQFLQQLKYKCEYAAKRFVEAGEWFPSTKQCSSCRKRNEISLSDRIYRCDCGLVIHRDDNSALNLRAVGTTVLKACGAAPLGER